jgi:ComF family protein
VQIPFIVRDVADWVYPGRCTACDSDCNGSDFLCYRCQAGLDHLAAAPACARCALPVVSNGAPCPWCHGRGLPPFQSIVRLGRFDEPLREMIHAMKYRRLWRLADELAGRLLAEDRVKRLLADCDVLVPVPLHWARHIGRGYNQADLLASALAKLANVRVVRPAVRVRHTPRQTGIHSRTEREENVRGAFALKRPAEIAAQRVVIVDDVMTTAATLQTLGRILKPAHPAQISALVLAVADPRGQDFQGI